MKVRSVAKAMRLRDLDGQAKQAVVGSVVALRRRLRGAQSNGVAGDGEYDKFGVNRVAAAACLYNNSVSGPMGVSDSSPRTVGARFSGRHLVLTGILSELWKQMGCVAFCSLCFSKYTESKLLGGGRSIAGCRPTVLEEV